MQNVENKIIAGMLILLTALMTGVFFMTLNIKNKISDRLGTAPRETVTLQPLDKAINETIKNIDSLSLHPDTSFVQSYGEVVDRLLGGHPDK